MSIIEEDDLLIQEPSSLVDLPSEMRLQILQYIIPKDLFSTKLKQVFYLAFEELQNYILISKRIFYDLLVEDCESYEPILQIWQKIEGVFSLVFKKGNTWKMDREKIWNFIELMNSSQTFIDICDLGDRNDYLHRLTDPKAKKKEQQLETFRIRLGRIHGITQNFSYLQYFLKWFSSISEDYKQEITKIHKTKKSSLIKNEPMIALIRAIFDRERIHIKFPEGLKDLIYLATYTELATDRDDDLVDCLVSSCIVNNLKDRKKVSNALLKFLFENPYGRNSEYKFSVVQSMIAKKDFKKLRDLSEYLLENEDAELIVLVVREMISSFYFFYDYFEKEPNNWKEFFEIISIYCKFANRKFTTAEVLSIVKLLTTISKDHKPFLRVYDHLISMNNKAIDSSMENEIIQGSIVLISKYTELFEMFIKRKDNKQILIEMCKDGSIFEKVFSHIIIYDDGIKCYRLIHQHVDAFQQFYLRLNNIKKIIGLKNFQTYLKGSNLLHLVQTIVKQCQPYKETTLIKRIIQSTNNYLNDLIN